MSDTASEYPFSEAAFPGHTRQDTGTTLAEPESPSFSLKTDDTCTPETTATIPNVLPPNHPVRTLVLCFDGTGDQ
jgi:hypothetical protein